MRQRSTGIQFLEYGGGGGRDCTIIGQCAIVHFCGKIGVHRRIFIRKCCLSMEKDVCHVRRLGFW